MEDTLVLKAEKRDITGTKSAVKVRKAGRIPGIVYGHKKESIAVSFDAHSLVRSLHHGSRLFDIQIDEKKDKVLLAASDTSPTNPSFRTTYLSMTVLLAPDICNVNIQLHTERHLLYFTHRLMFIHNCSLGVLLTARLILACVHLQTISRRPQPKIQERTSFAPQVRVLFW
jgi:large subunit ribosomal protein L25